MPVLRKSSARTWSTLLSRVHFNGRQFLISLGLVTICVVTAMAVVSYQLYSRVFVSTVQPSASPTTGDEPQPSPTPEDPLRPISIALLGYGGVGHAGGSLTDSMMIVHIRPRDQKIWLISLPRDVWVKLPVQDPPLASKINAAYSIGLDDRRYSHKPAEYSGEAGGGALAKYALSQVLGMPIDYFVAVDFEGFRQAIDKLNGVVVNVQRPFSDPYYPITGKEDDTCGKSPEEIVAIATLSATKAEQAYECRYEVLTFEAGKQLMDGETALKFVRSRHSPQDGGDINRAARQRALILGMKDRLLTLDAVPKLPSLIAGLSWHIRTDIPLPKLQEWIGQASEFQTYAVGGIALTDKEVLQPAKSIDGQYILVPIAGEDSWQSVHEWVQAQLTQPLPQ